MTNEAAVKDDDSENMDEFFDATDASFGGSESDVYDDDVHFIVDEGTDYLNEDVMFEMDELGLMLNATLASDYNGANAARLNAIFFNDWTILLEKQAIELGFPDLEQLLRSEYMRDYVEQTSSINGIAIYRAVSKPANEHILRRVAECRLNDDQKAKKRRIQRLLELKNPENERNFLEGKRRILQILLDLKADKTEVDYQVIRDEYMKRYKISLNASEHQRLFMNKSALKNFWRAFYREVILLSGCPIRVKLRSSDVKIPEEITEDLRLLVNVDKIELPIFPLECRPLTSNFMRERRAVEYAESVVVPTENVPKKPTMDWGEEVEEDEEKQLNDGKQRRDDIGNADRVNGMVPSSLTKIKSVSEDKYTDDEESADSSDSETEVSRKYRRKFKRNLNTFNISSASSEQSGKRLSIAERSLQQSFSYSQDRFPSSSTVFNSAGLIPELNKVPYGSYTVPNSAAGQCTLRQAEDTSSYSKLNENVRSPFSSKKIYILIIIADKSHDDGWATNAKHMQSSQSNRIQQHGQDYLDDCAASVKFFSSDPQIMQLSKETQTDENWLEALLDELGCHNSVIIISACSLQKKSPLKKLAEVIELIVDIRSPNPVLVGIFPLSALPQIVGSLYGTPIKPEDDENYRKAWKEIVRDYCSAEILISPLPNGEEVLVKKKCYC
ncbi:unnamed protein product [Acanthocheilonema viteae]|uniref:Uncharacterized protein n=1 Tax=Acanthocheilonema viteae TaxID=6277 RepID=A0A498SAR8_ACAVI|nr:unnamed protein product [Acanthocheilonema viteae]